MPRARKPKPKPRSTPTDDPRDRLRRHLELLGLTYTLAHLDEHLTWAIKEKAGATALLERVLGLEAQNKLENRIERRIKTSGLPARKSLEAFDWNFQSGLDKALVLELARLDFVHRADDLVITGKSGTGKSHVLQALALVACSHQLAVRYTRCTDLIDDLYAGLGDGTYPARLKRWCAPDFLIIDDVGLGQVKKRDDEPTAAHFLFTLIDRRHTHATTAITSNIKLSAWGRYLGDVALAAAVLDRLAMRAIRIDIDGPSYRQHLAHQRAKQRGGKPLPDDEATAESA